ncbi:MAG: hypothetical protein ACK528_11805 [Alphaproteobacteria bacterium]|jgi:hypothetical protein
MPKIDQLIEHLQSFQKRKAMYVGHVSIETVEAFMTGFRIGRHGMGLENDRELQWATEAARGWEQSAAGPVLQMKSQGLSDNEIMDELIEIEIDVLRELAKRLA